MAAAEKKKAAKKQAVVKNKWPENFKFFHLIKWQNWPIYIEICWISVSMSEKSLQIPLFFSWP
jgi:hypothetical protein